MRINSVENNLTKTADSTAGYTADTWYTAIAVFATTTSRSSYLNGTNKATNTDSSTPNIPSGGVTAIGATFNTNMTPSGPLNGKIAACAFYNTNLSDAQVAALHTAMATLVA